MTEGTYPKSDGDIYYGTDANITMSLESGTIQNAIRNSKNSIGNETSITSQYVPSDAFEDTSLVDTVNTTWNNSGYTYNLDFSTAFTYDECKNSAVSAVLWDDISDAASYSITEDTSQMSIGYTGADNDEANKVIGVQSTRNYKTYNATKSIVSAVITLDTSVSGDDFTQGCVKISDGTSTVSIITQPFNGGNPTTYNLKFKFDPVAQTVAVTNSDVAEAGSPFDLSSLTAYKLWFGQVNAAGGARSSGLTPALLKEVRNYKIGDIPEFRSNDMWTPTDTIIAATSSVNVNSVFNRDNMALTMTADNSNWESVTEDVHHKFTNTGTNLKFKLLYTLDTDDLDNIYDDDFPILYGWGAIAHDN